MREDGLTLSRKLSSQIQVDIAAQTGATDPASSELGHRGISAFGHPRPSSRGYLICYPAPMGQCFGVSRDLGVQPTFLGLPLPSRTGSRVGVPGHKGPSVLGGPARQGTKGAGRWGATHGRISARVSSLGQGVDDAAAAHLVFDPSHSWLGDLNGAVFGS